MSKKKQDIEVIESESGLRVFGTPVTDALGNEAYVHESIVPEDEGGPFVWLSLRRPGEEESAGVLLDFAQAEALRNRLNAAMEVWK